MQPKKFKDVTRSADMKLKYQNALRQQVNEFKVNQMRKEITKDNKLLFMKLVEIQNGKHPMLNIDTTDARLSVLGGGQSGLGGYTNHQHNAQIASTQRLSNSHSRPLIQSAKNKYAHFMKEQNYANELA